MERLMKFSYPEHKQDEGLIFRAFSSLNRSGMRYSIKTLFFTLAIFCVFSTVSGETASKCYLDVRNPEEIESEIINQLSISLISKYVEKVETIPGAGISNDECIYQVSVNQSNGTLLVTLSGKQLNGIGESGQKGIDGIQEAILKALFNGSLKKRGEICRDFKDKIPKECQNIDLPYAGTPFPGVRLPSASRPSGTLPKGICSAPQPHRDYRHCNLERKHFKNADLSGSDFSGVNLERAHFINCKLPGSNFKGANLTRTIFKESTLSGVDFSGSNMTRSRFKGSNLAQVNFTGSQLNRAVFRGINLDQVLMKGVQLERADFDQSTLNQVDMSGANLEKASFHQAVLNQVILVGANLDDVDLSRATLNDVVR